MPASVWPPVLLLLAYGIAFAAAALGRSPTLAFDDHPGQLYRVWHVVHHGFAPWAWNPGWWAGYPELQFYPPGFAYAAAALHRASVAIVSVPAAYHALLWATYLAPGVASFALLARVTGNGWHALPGAFVALTLSAGVASGVEGGVHWGMVSARLGWALLPLLLLALARWSEGDGPLPYAVPPLIAALALTHPAHAPTAVLVVLGAALASGADRRRRLAGAGLLLALGFALTAFWSIPLLARLAHTRALAWGSLGEGAASALTRPLPLVLMALALLALRPGAAVPRPRTAALIARLPWLVGIAIALDAAIAEPVGIRWLPASRIADGGWMALVLAAGLGGAQVIRALSASRRLGPAASAIAGVALLSLLSLPGQTLTLWPRPGEWPAYGQVERGFRLPALWDALRSGPDGRVLFARSGLPLVHGSAWYRPHSHVTALTPLRAGRDIVHGTFTHPSPVAAFTYRGDAGPGPITQLAEQLDGVSLFGRPYGALEAARLADVVDRLGIATVVVLDEDLAARDAIAATGIFPAPASLPPFLVYARRGVAPVPREVGRGRWQVALEGDPGEWVSARVAFYPLWHAAQGGRSLATRRGRLGELEVRLDRADVAVDLRYEPGRPEWAGPLVSAGAALAWLGLLARVRRARHRPAGLTRGGRS